MNPLESTPIDCVIYNVSIFVIEEQDTRNYLKRGFCRNGRFLFMEENWTLIARFNELQSSTPPILSSVRFYYVGFIFSTYPDYQEHPHMFSRFHIYMH